MRRFIARWFRRLFLCYPENEYAELPDGRCRDALMPSSDEEAGAVAKTLYFPESLTFGAATAAYQIEGGVGDTNWSRWEDLKVREVDGGETVADGIGAGVACDSWNRFEDDLQVITALGLKCYRFSVEWSRVEPVEGRFDEAAIERYASWCKALRSNGVEPMVTLHHFTEPGWFSDKGGWEVGANVECFARFARHLVARLAPHCSTWCTLNEPWSAARIARVTLSLKDDL